MQILYRKRRKLVSKMEIVGTVTRRDDGGEGCHAELAIVGSYGQTVCFTDRAELGELFNIVDSTMHEQARQAAMERED